MLNLNYISNRFYFEERRRFVQIIIEIITSNFEE